jgi:DNA-binding response OmpR family regulator
MRHFVHVVSVLPLDQQFYRDDHLFVHLRHQVAMLDGEAIFLTRMEYRLLALWCNTPERLYLERLSRRNSGGFSPRRTRAGWLYTWVVCEKN